MLSRSRSCLLYVPRDKYNTEQRQRFQRILAEAFNGTAGDFSVSLSESPLARILMVVRTRPGAVPKVDVRELERSIAAATRRWEDELQTLLLEREDDPQQRFVAASYGDLRVVNVYVPNGSAVGSDKYAYKLAWLADLRGYLASALAQWPRLLVMGDFNIAPADMDVHDPVAWDGQVLVSPAEREALDGLTALGLHDAFRALNPDMQAFTWWDYRAAAFRRNQGLRIDHLLVSGAVREVCRSCRVEMDVRRLERPSDHAPVVLELDLPATG